MPFLAFTSSQIAQSHLSSGMGLPSKIVPTLTENWRLVVHLSHSQSFRVFRNRTFLDSQFGHSMSPGHRRATMKSKALSPLAKNLTASWRVCGSSFSGVDVSFTHPILLSQVYYCRSIAWLDLSCGIRNGVQGWKKVY